MKKSASFRKLLSAVCCLAMLVTMLPIVPAAAADNTLLIAPNPNAGTTISGGSLSSFSDAADITYTKAAEITAGLKLFEGAGGKFMPKSNLTRAQMATIIVKMLNGSDANANSFKGNGKFSDTAIFEGGWAEGYINWCATLGIVSGYGDGTFKPGNKVTAAEAATMILNALKVDAGEGEWPHTVMAKAEELDMFDDLLTRPANDQALTREELAVMALVGLEYSPDGKQVDGVEAVKDFYIATSLEHIGHYVEVYYSEPYTSEREPGLTYTIYDETQVFTVDEAITTAKEYKAVFGKSYKPAAKVALFGDNYVVNNIAATTLDGYKEGTTAKKGTYFVNDGIVVAYMAPVTAVATRVTSVNTYEGNETIVLKDITLPISNSEDDDRIVEYKGIAKDDYVTYTKVGAEGREIYVLSQAKPVTGTVTKISTNDDGEKVVTLNGQQYVAFSGDNKLGQSKDEVPSDFAATYTFYITADNKYVFWEKSDGAVDLNNTVFILGANTVKAADSYGKTVLTTYARGVDMDGKEVMLPVRVQNAVKNGDNYEPVGDGIYHGVADGDEYVEIKAKTFYTIEPSNDKQAKKEGIYALTAVASDYDEEKSPIYQKRYAPSIGYSLPDTELNVAGKMSYKQSTTVYLDLVGTLDQTTPLTATVKKGSRTAIPTQSGQTVEVYLMLSRNAENAQMLEVMLVIQCEETKAAASGVGVYIAGNWAETEGRSVDGYTYEVYDYATGTPKSITLQKALSNEYYKDVFKGAGFYKIVPVEGEECMDLFQMAPGSASTEAGNTYERNVDGFLNENFFYDQVVKEIVNDKLSTMQLSAFGTNGGSVIDREGKPSDAIVVDLRSEEDIVSNGVGKIDSLDRVLTLTSENPEMVIPLDICYSTSSSKVLTVYVKDLYYATAAALGQWEEKNGTIYINNIPVKDGSVVKNNSMNPVVQIDNELPVQEALQEIESLLTPKPTVPGYPNESGWKITLEYEINGGEITDLAIAKGVKPGVILEDSFDSYTFDDFDIVEVAKNGYSKISGNAQHSKVALGSIVHENDGNNYIEVRQGRYYVIMPEPDGAYTVEVDIRMPELKSNFCVWLGHIDGVESGNDSLRLYVSGANEGKIYLDDNAGTSKTKYYLTKDGKLDSAGKDNAVAIEANEWWHLRVLVVPETGYVSISAGERGGEMTTGSVNVGPITNGTQTVCLDMIPTYANADTNHSTQQHIDNLSYKTVSDHEYKITTDNDIENGELTVSPQKGMVGQAITVTTTPDAGYVVNEVIVRNNGELDSTSVRVATKVEDNKYTFDMDEHPAYVTATFAEGHTVEAVQPDKGGTISVSTDFEASGKPVTVTAETEEHYTLESVIITDMNGTVLDTVSASKNKATFVMQDKDVKVIATFEDDRVTLKDDFSAYGTGSFNGKIAASKGKTYLHWSGTAEVTDGGELKATAGTVNMGMHDYVPTSGNYSIEFDLKRTEGTNNTYLRIGSKDGDNYAAGSLRLFIGNSVSPSVSNQVYLKDDNTGYFYFLKENGEFFSTKTAGDTNKPDNIVTMPKDKLWHIKVTVNSAGKITVAIGEKDGTTYSAEHDFKKAIVCPGTTGCCLLTLATADRPQYVDNLKITKILAD